MPASLSLIRCLVKPASWSVSNPKVTFSLRPADIRLLNAHPAGSVWVGNLERTKSEARFSHLVRDSRLGMNLK